MTLVLAYTPAGSYTAAPTLDRAVSGLRQDLFDRVQNMPLLAGQPTPQRWADDDLARALDRALDEYSFVSPLVQAVMTATLPSTRAYAYPAGAWWVESVEYPSGLWPPVYVPFEEMVSPSLGTPSAPQGAASGAGSLTGSYQWAVTFIKSGGETVPGPLSGAVVLAGQAAAVGAIPTGPPGTVGRNVYRSKGGGPLGRVAQLLDNTTTSLGDDVADGAVGVEAPSADTTANLQQVLLRLNPARVPQDTSGVLTVTYACKHQWTEAGTSIPEQHHDVVMLGAAAYAVLAYQVPTNDLFEYQDGELRSKVSERYVPGAWLAAGQRLLSQFQDRLAQVKAQRNAGAAAVAVWGDVPYRWQRT